MAEWLTARVSIELECECECEYNAMCLMINNISMKSISRVSIANLEKSV